MEQTAKLRQVTVSEKHIDLLDSICFQLDASLGQLPSDVEGFKEMMDLLHTDLVAFQVATGLSFSIQNT